MTPTEQSQQFMTAAETSSSDTYGITYTDMAVEW